VVERARRARFVIDGEEYFAAAFAAMRGARRTISLLGWDLDLRVRERPGAETTLRDFLEALVAERPELRVRLLIWDMADALALMRPILPPTWLDWVTHDRLTIKADAAHPTGSAHHQKVLVVDDAVAFSGGMDIAGNRWDTRAHVAGDPRRRDPDGTPYEPRHDLMLMVDGDAAARLGALFRERWHLATGEALDPAEPPGPHHDPWPAGIAPDLRDVPVGLARTRPSWEGVRRAQEVETLFLDSIAAARRCIYIENQYFASRRIAEAVAARLREPDGPEVVIVTSLWGPSWIEHHTMNALRDALIHALRAEDRHDRFRVYGAVTEGEGITVHAKVMVVDDRIVRIGSANINDRSLGVDTECDAVVEAVPGEPGAEDAARAILDLRDDLVAEHLGVARARVAGLVARTGSLVRTIDALRGTLGTQRTLRPIEPRELGPVIDLVDNFILNPSRPTWRTPPGRAIRAALFGAAGAWCLWRAWRLIGTRPDDRHS
jgi:phosphatidylserine/phosphatidylglycerophosphate/cardiolipin synthase-like enzyme